MNRPSPHGSSQHGSSRRPSPRPTLLPGLRPLWRDSHTVQVGTDPRRAMIMELPHPAAAQLLDMLDGSFTEPALLAELAKLGLPEADARGMLCALADAGLVVPAGTLLPTALEPAARERLTGEAAALIASPRKGTPAQVLRRRETSLIIISGPGRLARLMARVLLDAGIGKVGRVAAPGQAARLLTDPSDHTGSTQSKRADTVRMTDADFVIHVGPATRGYARGTRRRVPHLALQVRDAVAVVGPLVPATGGPCLNCLDLHRTDRDPAWPRLAAQLAGQDVDMAASSASTLFCAAGFATAEVLALLDGGEPTTIGTTVEINGNAPWRRRTWMPHPACDCGRRRSGHRPAPRRPAASKS